MKTESLYKILLIPLLFSACLSSYILLKPIYAEIKNVQEFSGLSSLSFAARQVNLGPRTYHSNAHEQLITIIAQRMRRFDWSVDLQTGSVNDRDIVNIIAMNSPNPPEILIGAHYDSRLYADQDLDLRSTNSAVPGANDGASGVAVLVELGRVLRSIDIPIWLVFFDAEDDGNINNQEWSMGSTFFVANLQNIPKSVIIIDMIGDRQLEVFLERNSEISLSKEIWFSAEKLGYSGAFMDSYKYSMQDDHIAFLNKGISTSLIIDFDYPFWHTTSDTLDKLSAFSLQIVGSTVVSWVLSQQDIVE